MLLLLFCCCCCCCCCSIFVEVPSPLLGREDTRQRFLKNVFKKAHLKLATAAKIKVDLFLLQTHFKPIHDAMYAMWNDDDGAHF